MTESDFEALLIYDENSANIIIELKNETLPLILWGAGDIAGAVKVYLERNDIFPVAVWVDNPTIDFFKGLPVLPLEIIKSNYDKFNVVMGHSHYDLGNDVYKNESQICKIFYLASVSYGQYENISYELIKQNIDKYFMTYQLLADQKSKDAMLVYLDTRMNNDVHFIQDFVKYDQTYFQNDIFSIERMEDYVDVGAFDGDTIRQFMEQCNGTYHHIYAFEPEISNFKKLERYVKRNQLNNISLYNIGTWKRKDTLGFDIHTEEEAYSIALEESHIQISVDTLDQVLNDKPVSMIKINFYHGVLETLMGAKKIIERNRPKLAIVVGFDEWAIIKIPQFIKNTFPEYKVYLRYNRCMPACLTLYAVW